MAAARKELASQVEALAALHARVADADRRKNAFLATLAHELRNPLTPIRNALHVIRLAGDNRTAVAQTRAMVERQLAHLVRLVDDLLDVSRISRGKIELRRESVELKAVVRQAIEGCSALIEHCGHQLDVSLPPVPTYVVADPARLAQVISYLLNNAAKYTRPSGRLSLSVSTQDAEVTIAVRDNGIGMPPDMLSCVFEMFTQVDTSIEKSRGGLGVGLAIVKRLVELHGGRVEARSDGPGRGSTFIVKLPLAHAAAPAKSTAPPLLPEMRQETRHRKRRILVVDDNVDLAQSLALMLQMLGHEVHTVHDGAAAVAAVPTLAPDLIFLDIGMPRMNGYDTCRAIRELSSGQVPVIVALSGWGQEQDKTRSREAGMDLHLVKPFDPALLESMLAKLGDRDHPAAPAVPASTDHATPEPSMPASEPAPGGEAAAGSLDAGVAVEAARYALYRRILPVLRHGLSGELQSVQFAVNLAERAARRDSAAVATHQAIERIAQQAQSAADRGRAIADWLRPDDHASTSVGEAVHACLDLVGTEWSLRGIEVKVAVTGSDAVVNAAVFRELLSVMLVTLGDAAPGAADITVKVRRRGDCVIVVLRSRPSSRDGDGVRVAAYRDLRWSDVEALARTHGIRWARRGDRLLARIPLVSDEAAAP